MYRSVTYAALRLSFLIGTNVSIAISAAAPATRPSDSDDPRGVLVQLDTAIKVRDIDVARATYVDSSPQLMGALDAFLAERMATRALVALLTGRFPDQVQTLQRSRLQPFTDEALNQLIAITREAELKPLRDGSVLIKIAIGQSAVAHKERGLWKIAFESMMNGRVSTSDDTRNTLFINQERQDRELAIEIAHRLDQGGYKGIEEAIRDYDSKHDALVFERRPRNEGSSTVPLVRSANAIVSWSLSRTCVIACSPNGKVKAWNFETGSATTQFVEQLKQPRVESEVACGPEASMIGLVDPNESKSLRVLAPGGRSLFTFNGVSDSVEVPNGVIERLIGFVGDGSLLVATQNNGAFVDWFDVGSGRVKSVTNLSDHLTDTTMSEIVLLRDGSAFVHFHGDEAIGYGPDGETRWRESLPNAEMPPIPASVFASAVPARGVKRIQRPRLEAATVVDSSTAFWMMQDKCPTRLDVRTGRMVPMPFDGQMSEVVAVDADHGYLVTRDRDDDGYWLWNARGQKYSVGNLSGTQRLAFSPDGSRLLALADSAAFADDRSEGMNLTTPIEIFRIGDVKCEESGQLY